MAVNMLGSLEEFLSKSSDALVATDDMGWTMLHQQASAGNTAGVKCLLKHGADPNTKSAVGLTPLQIAKGLGWRDVTRLLSN